MEQTHEHVAPTPRRPGWVLPTAASGLLIVASLGTWNLMRATSPNPPTPAIAPATQIESASTELPALPSLSGKVASLDQLLGTWVCNDSIRRSIQVREDGTASMNVKLDFVASLLYGSELDLELTWKLDGDSLVYSAVSGEPKANVERLLKDFGRQQTYNILEFQDGRMLLEDRSDQCRYDWQREAL